MAEMVKVLVVGRHTPDLGSEAENIEIIGQENVTFSLSRGEAEAQLEGLFQTASAAGANAILLQNVPGVLAAALLSEQIKAGGQLPYRVGVIISVPGPRLAGVSVEREFINPEQAGMAIDLVEHANGRARFIQPNGNTVVVEVDPVSAFVFSHIEWLS